MTSNLNLLRPIDRHDESGPEAADGAPIPCEAFHCLEIRQQAVEAAVGRERYAELLYQASYKSARYWCDKVSRTQGLAGMAVFEQYLRRLSLRGWGTFSVIEADVAKGCADIRLDHSALVLAQAEVCAAKTCFRFAGWFAGMMDWIGENTGRPFRTSCQETQCGADGHEHCVFAVRQRALH